MSFDEGFDWGSNSRRGRNNNRRRRRDEFGALPRSPSEALEPSRAPDRPHRTEKAHMHPVFAFLNRTMTLLVILFMLLGGIFYYIKLLFDSPGPLDHSTVVVIPKGEGVNGIAARLEKHNAIVDRRLFVASVLYFKAQKKLKAGEYEIRKNASMRQVLDTITQGRSILHRISIPEGLTSQQVMARMEGHEMLSGRLLQVPPEGSLLPDTYKFTRGLSRPELIERMQAEQKSFIDGLWESRAPNLPFTTKEEAIILASIVEKETGRPDERRHVAGVFINRLRKKMRLQSDPTIIYGLVGGKGTLGRPILRSELEKKTDYNTYFIDGLPPGPIANPGRAAIEAVLNPEETEDLFFVADGTGGHVFAATLQDHQKNVANWRKIVKEIRAREAAENAANGGDAAAATNGVVQEVTNGADAGANSSMPGVSVTPGDVALNGQAANGAAAETATVSGDAIPIPERKPAIR